MTQVAESPSPTPPPILKSRHILSIAPLSREEIIAILDLADRYVELNRQIRKKQSVLSGRTQINLFFEASTRTQSSFELAGKRLGADVMNMSVSASAVAKGETLLDTAMTLNAMQPDLLIVRHHASGAAGSLARKVSRAVINAGDGQHEHPTQALLDAHHPPPPQTHRGAGGGDLRRRRPLPGGAPESPAVPEAWRRGTAHRAIDPASRRGRAAGRHHPPRHARGTGAPMW